MGPSGIAAPDALVSRVTGETISAAATQGAAGITVTGLVSGTSCPTLQFNVYTYVIKTSANTIYSGGSCANIQAGTVMNFTGTRPSNNELVFYADTITLLSGLATTPAPKPEPAPDTPPAGQTWVTISSLVTGTACPDLQFRSGSYVFKTSSATKYDGGGCTGLKSGLTIGVGGTKQGDSIVIVSAVTFKKDGTSTTTPPADDSEPVETDVVVGSLLSGSACPYLQFTAGDARFVAARTTRFDGGSCDSVQSGSVLHVVGAKRKSDGLVLLSAVAIAQPIATAPKTPEPPATPDPPAPAAPSDPNPATIASTFTVTSLVAGTACPALAFSVNGYTVKLDEHTQYYDGACADIRPRTRLYVHAIVAGEKTVRATLVAFLD